MMPTDPVVLVTNGDLGEHAITVCAQSCAGLAFLGIELDVARNTTHAPVNSPTTSRVTVRVISTDEACMIPRSVSRLATSHAPTSHAPSKIAQP